MDFAETKLRPHTEPAKPLLHVRRALMRGMGQFYQGLFTRLTLRGLENIPKHGPLLVLPSYISDLDPHVIVSQFPGELEVVAQGEFKNIGLKSLAVKSYAPTFVHRGYADRDALRNIAALLEAGRMVMMFPTGGMWEKPLIAKPGAAYLSQITQSPILPVGIGGTYLKGPDVLALRRPKITVTFGEVMPPVPMNPDRRKRREELDIASEAIMQRVYNLLPSEDQARYARWAREVHDLCFEFADTAGNPITYDGLPLPEMGALAEFISKPNLFRPMWKNAKLPVDPFRFKRYFDADAVRTAARALYHALTAGEFETYLSYRLGNEKTAAILNGLLALDGVADWAAAHDARVRLVPVAYDPTA